MRAMQEPIITALGVQPTIDAAAEVEARIAFLADYLGAAPGIGGYVLGISGGQDSSLAGRLVQLAVERVRAAGQDVQFLAVRLPYGVQHDEDDAQLALEFIGADRVVTVNVAPAVDAMVDELVAATGEPVTDFNKGNIKARARMVAQYGIAGDRRMLVVGTDHAAEAVTGFYTKFGDGAADVTPLAGLNKRQGAAMLEALDAPRRLWEKIPTADLLDDNPGQTDEDNLGVSYAHIDDYLEGREVPDAAAERIEHLYRVSEHKRRMPVAPTDTFWRNAR
ncbi:ammonia-dependent NAD(+) synthetase [Leucobacter sp. cx-42]|uniref:ammonia-dependent NAD(+) synthetase n=1 Tax=unclassified Leucobacter TaxID=2621730 RepID=UPI00165E6D73|nr:MULTISPECIES: ammonia-dependent NAD(+) synthetase [unclassified Leucobacter]MBC9955334.1 ammonia-dependent NAD(+) synthetase [Leucobacter sp. cx-42]